MNYYPHHIGDYLKDTAHLSMIEDGAYRRLMDVYYAREAMIPLDLKQACRLVRASSKEDKEAVATVLEEFFTRTDDGWRHGRCEAEIEKARVLKDAARQNGRKGGRPRKQNPDETQTDKLENPAETQRVISGLLKQNPNETQTKAPNPNPITHLKDNPLPPPSSGPVWQLPDWIPKPLWQQFEEVRKRRKKPLTDKARQLAANKLAALRDDGNDMQAVVEQTVLHAWDTFYPLKTDALPAKTEWEGAL